MCSDLIKLYVESTTTKGTRFTSMTKTNNKISTGNINGSNKMSGDINRIPSAYQIWK